MILPVVPLTALKFSSSLDEGWAPVSVLKTCGRAMLNYASSDRKIELRAPAREQSTTAGHDCHDDMTVIR